VGVVYECVPNVSEGRDRAALDALTSACGQLLVDVHSDADHHRSVLTLATEDPVALEAAVRALAREVVARCDIGTHEGVHPRLGALDVVPFVALGGGAPEREVATGLARRFADWAGSELDLPCFLYGDVDALGRSLPDARREAFRSRRPDHGPMRPHVTAGATAVGARPPLVAANAVLDTDDLVLATRVAGRVREAGGGPPGVRALGLWLAASGRVQVSMNLVDLTSTGLQDAVGAVEAALAGSGAAVAGVEVVGLVPRSESETWSTEFRERWGLTDALTVESRLDTPR